MARKKMARKTATRNSKKIVRKKTPAKNARGTLKNKMRLVISNLLLFIALSLVSFILYQLVQNDFLNNLFFVIALIFGFIGVGFLIAFLVLTIMKLISKRR